MPVAITVSLKNGLVGGVLSAKLSGIDSSFPVSFPVFIIVSGGPSAYLCLPRLDRC